MTPKVLAIRYMITLILPPKVQNVRKMTHFVRQSREISFEYAIYNIAKKYPNKHRHSIGNMAGFQKVRFALQISRQ